MIKQEKKFIIENKSYIIKIEVIPNLYTKLQIFENFNDITNVIMTNQPLFNKLLGLMSFPKIHHTIPKFLLEKWRDSNDFFHEIIIEKDSENILFKTEKKTKKYLNSKFSGLHNYTFNFDNRIVIFEGSFINLVEKYIDSLLDYINLLDNNLDNIKKIKSVNIPFNGKNIDFTDIIIQHTTKIIINGNIIYNINPLNIRLYNRVISEFYIKCVFHYTTIYDSQLFFKELYKFFSINIPINGIDKTIYLYFFMVSNQTESKLKEIFGINYCTCYMKSPSTYKFPISEIWRYQTKDENNKINAIIPINPDYVILISSDQQSLENFKNKINKDNYFLTIFIENQIKTINSQLYNDKFKESKDGNKIVNKKYSILSPDLNTLNIMKEYIQNKKYNKKNT